MHFSEINIMMSLNTVVLFVTAPKKKGLDLITDKNLNFHSHVKRMCKVVAQKLNALSRKSRTNIHQFGCFADETSIIWSTEYTKEHLDYAPWNESLSCDEQLILANNETIHVKNLLSLHFGALKYVNGLCLPILENLFTIRKNSYNLRDHRELEAANKNTKLVANLQNCGGYCLMTLKHLTQTH